MANSIKLSLIIFSFLFLQQLISSNGQNNIIKGGYWFKASGFPLNNIDSSLFTHLFCAFADLDSQSNQLIVSTDNQESFGQFTSTVQRKNPSVKTLLSVGGGGGGADKKAYGVMARTPTSRKSFIDSSIKLARQLGFHGLDLDWEYPESATDMTNLGTLLNEFRAAVNTEARNSGRTALLLTAAVSNSPRVNGLNYPVQSVARSLDWLNVMSYDFYAPDWSPSQTNSHAQLFDPLNHLSGSDGTNAWIQAGVPAQKLVLGIPLYGYAWQLVGNNRGLRAPANGKANAISTKDGSMTYSQIKDFIVQNRATTVYDATIVGDYCHSGSTWISYDDTQSVKNKVTYVKSKGLCGYFEWHVGADQNWVLSRTASQA